MNNKENACFLYCITFLCVKFYFQELESITVIAFMNLL